jgi:putative ABC transport system permease protein
MHILTEIQESGRIAWAAIRANKLRSGLTTLGVVIGILTATLVGTMLNGMTQSFERSVSNLGADVLFLSRFPWMTFDDFRLYRNRREITLQNYRELERQLTTAAAIAPQAEDYGVSVIYERRKAKNVWLVGNTESGLYIRGLTVAKGRWISASDVSSSRAVCVIGAFLAESFFPNDEPIGKKIRIHDTPYEIIGVLDKMGNLLGWDQDNQVVVPVSRFALDVRQRPDYVITIKALSPDTVVETREEARAIFRRIRKIDPGRQDDFAINQQDAIAGFFSGFKTTLASFGFFVTGLSLFVGGIGIMNIMFVSVAERTKEIGVRKALGAKRRTILTQFLIEAATITLFAGLIGIGAAWPISWKIGEIARANGSVFEAAMSWWIVTIALVISAGTGMVAGFIPAWRASRMDPVEALRSE